MANDKRFAVLIDADNVASKYIKVILDEISNDGEATYKRVYGDWTKPGLTPWKRVLLEHSIIPIQQYGYTSGKNSTDAAMIIDAMDILYSDNVEGFCLVTSDSDFTRLAARLRESGMMVVGMGEQKTPKAFISACNKFKYIDILYSQTQSKAESRKSEERPKDTDGSARQTKSETASKPAKPTKPTAVKATSKEKEPLAEAAPSPVAVKDPKTGKYKAEDMGILPVDFDAEVSEENVAEITSLETIRDAIASILEENSDEDGWVPVSDLGNRILKRYPDFDVRNFGYPKLTLFLRTLPGFEMKSVRTDNSNVKQVYLRELQEG